MVRIPACVANDKLLRQMVADGESMSRIAKTIGTNKRHVKAYIEKHQIPHEPFRKGAPLHKNSHWNGGRIIDEDGYVLLKRREHPYCDRHGYVREHRLVMEQKLERYLEPGEVVHHIDGNRQNNTPDNLQVFARNAEHLAETLRGNVPNWTPDGLRRIQEGIRKPRPQTRKANRESSKPDASQ